MMVGRTWLMTRLVKGRVALTSLLGVCRLMPWLLNGLVCA